MDIVLLLIAGILLTGLIFGKLARLVKMPNVTGYLVGGVILVLIFKLCNILFIFHSISFTSITMHMCNLGI